jgi:hypothetical protein
MDLIDARRRVAVEELNTSRLLSCQEAGAAP